MRFFTSDLHLGHGKLAEARGFDSTEEHDNFLVQAWNSVVEDRQDRVFVLGDIFWTAKTFKRLVGQLRGNITLVMGNHDNLSTRKMAEAGIKLRGAIEYRGAVLTHVPVHADQFPRFNLNVHGHLHAKAVMRGADPRYFNVAVERNNLRPFREEEIAWVQ